MELLKKKLDKKGKSIVILLIIIIVILLLFIFGKMIYAELFGYEHKKDVFEKDFENLIVECRINSCTDEEYEEKLDALKKVSGLSEKDMNLIIVDELYD